MIKITIMTMTLTMTTTTIMMTTGLRFGDQVSLDTLPFVDCQPDSTLPSIDPFNVGNDLIGAAIAASIASRARGKITVNHRLEARALVSRMSH